jgi:hypothetical protein
MCTAPGIQKYCNTCIRIEKDTPHVVTMRTILDSDDMGLEIAREPLPVVTVSEEEEEDEGRNVNEVAGKEVKEKKTR